MLVSAYIRLFQAALLATTLAPVFIRTASIQLEAVRTTPNISGIMAANLLGAMLGGLLEYNSMKFGFQALYMLGIAVYGLAALSYLLSHRIRTA